MASVCFHVLPYTAAEAERFGVRRGTRRAALGIASDAPYPRLSCAAVSWLSSLPEITEQSHPYLCISAPGLAAGLTHKDCRCGARREHSAWRASRGADLRNEAVMSDGARLPAGRHSEGGRQEREQKGVPRGSHQAKAVLEQGQSSELSLPPALRALACGKDLLLFWAL